MSIISQKIQNSKGLCGESLFRDSKFFSHY